MTSFIHKSHDAQYACALVAIQKVKRFAGEGSGQRAEKQPPLQDGIMHCCTALEARWNCKSLYDNKNAVKCVDLKMNFRNFLVGRDI